jgi:nitrous oxidase accessory protein NosD
MLAAALVLLTACSSGSDDDTAAAASPSSASAAPETSAPVTPVTPAAPPAGCDGATVVDVATADDLQRALDAAAPGQVIRLADGTYEGTFVASAVATADQPVQLCGTRGAILDGGEIDGDYTLHLSGAAYWQVSGFTVTGGQKGVMVDAGVGNRIEGLLVTSMGDEAIHLRANSTDNIVTGNTVRNTGLRKPKFGEGVYVGTAESNWCQITDCEPDRSDRNVIEGNDIAGTTAEAVDIKEGTTGGTLRGNTFDGDAMVEADSWVDVKGNGWTIEDNSGTAAPTDGFQVHEVVDGWGQENVFIGNSAEVSGDGLVINVAGPRTIRASTEVRCDNVAEGSDAVSNIECGSS